MPVSVSNAGSVPWGLSASAGALSPCCFRRSLGARNKLSRLCCLDAFHLQILSLRNSGTERALVVLDSERNRLLLCQVAFCTRPFSLFPPKAANLGINLVQLRMRACQGRTGGPALLAFGSSTSPCWVQSLAAVGEGLLFHLTPCSSSICRRCTRPGQQSPRVLLHGAVLGGTPPSPG